MLIFTFDYPPNDGGIARLCAAIVEGFSRVNGHLSVVTQEIEPTRDAQPYHFRNTTYLISVRPFREIKAYQFLRKRPRGEVCITGIWYPEGLIATLAGLNPRIILAHGAELFPPRQRWRRPLWRRLQRGILESAHLVIANSHYTAELVRSAAPAAKVTVLPLAVDHEFFAPGNRVASRHKWQISSKHVLCSVSRIHAFKGHEMVLRALASLPVEVRIQFTYLVAGKGPHLDALKSQARELGISEQVRWLGFVPDEELPSVYQAADLFVLMTREQEEEQAVEGFGLVFLESQACGIPVVGTRTGGIPDAVLSGESGFLIEEDDVHALEGIFLDLYRDPQHFVLMGQKARERVEREFTWAHYVQRFVNAVESRGITFDG